MYVQYIDVYMHMYVNWEIWHLTHTCQSIMSNYHDPVLLMVTPTTYINCYSKLDYIHNGLKSDSSNLPRPLYHIKNVFLHIYVRFCEYTNVCTSTFAKVNIPYIHSSWDFVMTVFRPAVYWKLDVFRIYYIWFCNMYFICTQFVKLLFPWNCKYKLLGSWTVQAN